MDVVLILAVSLKVCIGAGCLISGWVVRDELKRHGFDTWVQTRLDRLYLKSTTIKIIMFCCFLIGYASFPHIELRTPSEVQHDFHVIRPPVRAQNQPGEAVLIIKSGGNTREQRKFIAVRSGSTVGRSHITYRDNKYDVAIKQYACGFVVEFDVRDDFICVWQHEFHLDMPKHYIVSKNIRIGR